MTVPFWSALLLAMLGLTIAGPQKNGTGDVIRQKCGLSWKGGVRP